MSSGSIAVERPLAALRFRDLRNFLAAATVANAGQFIAGLATPFLMQEITESPAWVGASGFASLAPSVFFTPVAGALSDRLDRKKIMHIAYGILIVLQLAMAAMYGADALTPWRIIGFQLTFGVMVGFQFTPTQAMPAMLVPQESIASAVRLLSFSVTGSRALGPAIGGVALAFSGPGLAYLICAAAYLFGFITLFSVGEPHVGAAERGSEVDPKTGQPYSLRRSYQLGIEYISQRPAMRLAIRSAFAIGFLAASIAFPLAASIADDMFNLGGGGLGALATAMGIGSVVASFYIAGRGASVALSKVETVALGCYALGALTLIPTSLFAFALLGYFLMGLAHMWHNVSLSTSIQVQLDEQYRGRVMSVWLVAVLAGVPLGSLVGGFLAAMTSTRTLVGVYAMAVAAYLIITLVRNDMMRGLDLQQPDP